MSKDVEGYKSSMSGTGIVKKMDAMVKPDCVITSDSQSLTIKTECIFENTVFFES